MRLKTGAGFKAGSLQVILNIDIKIKIRLDALFELEKHEFIRGRFRTTQSQTILVLDFYVLLVDN